MKMQLLKAISFSQKEKWFNKYCLQLKAGQNVDSAFFMPIHLDFHQTTEMYYRQIAK
jgi:hypothetical protein